MNPKPGNNKELSVLPSSSSFFLCRLLLLLLRLPSFLPSFILFFFQGKGICHRKLLAINTLVVKVKRASGRAGERAETEQSAERVGVCGRRA